MAASEVIEEIKRLPPAEQYKVQQFVQALVIDSPPVKYIPEDEFRRSMKAVFEEHSELFKKLAQ